MRNRLLKQLVELHHPTRTRVVHSHGATSVLVRPGETVIWDPRPPRHPSLQRARIASTFELLEKSKIDLQATHARYYDEGNPDAGVVLCDEKGSPRAFLPTDVYDDIRRMEKNGARPRL